MNCPVNSLLDLDFYKLTMCQLVWAMYKNNDINVTYEFKNRTKDIRLLDYIDIKEFDDYVKYVLSLRFTFDELNYLKSLKIFTDDFLNYLSTIDGSKIEYSLFKKENELYFTFTGQWNVSILYETIFLSILNEMFSTKINKVLDNNVGIQKLNAKINLLTNPNIKIIEFGTRRRYSKDWQDTVLCMMLSNRPKNIIGTSNVLLAKKYNIKPVGTMAHEWFMVRAAIDLAGEDFTIYDICSDKDCPCEFKLTQKKSIEHWQFYYNDLSIILSDTFGTDQFFKDFDYELVNRCQGVRHDSGDPFEFGNKVIKHYKRLNINSKDKTIVFSDGLDIDKIVDLYDTFNQKINVMFGWGTNLTNDVGIKPLSIVIKATEVNGVSCVKLSDNINKVTGTKEMIDIYSLAFNYKNNISERLIY